MAKQFVLPDVFTIKVPGYKIFLMSHTVAVSPLKTSDEDY